MAFVLWGALFPQALATSSQNVLDITTEKFGWFYLIATFFFLIFSLFLAFSRFGKIKLGADTDEPEYSGRSWFAMLFSAGMGIGLVFWGTAEPLSHYMNPPQGASPQSAEAARLAMRYSFFHWGLHAWAIYTVIGLAIAYFTFRKNRSIIPFNGGIKYYFNESSFDGFYAGAELGLNFVGGDADSETELGFSPQIGYHLPVVDISLRYSLVDDFDYVAFRVAYVFDSN